MEDTYTGEQTCEKCGKWCYVEDIKWGLCIDCYLYYNDKADEQIESEGL